VGLVLAGGIGLLIGLQWLGSHDPARLRAAAETAAQAGRWDESLALWRRINATPAATGSTLLGEGRACLATGRAAQAERALRRAVAAAPGESQAWLLLLEILRVEDRPLEAQTAGWNAAESVAPEAIPEILRELTWAALTDVPDDVARGTLKRWIEADPDDLDARVALLRRIGSDPRSDDPDREARLAELSALLSAHPDHVGLREVMVSALADAGEPERGRKVLEDWPPESRDARYWRLRGRWELDHNHQPEQAVVCLRKVLGDFPQDWRTHYRLARALQTLNDTEEARREAETVSRIRELLDPMTLGPRLEAAFAHLDDAESIRTLSMTCERVGLVRLARAWIASASRARERSSPNESETSMLPHMLHPWAVTR
jgi:tetratricopeptide (TPR) repeat protein